MSQRTIVVAQAAHSLDLVMKFKTSPIQSMVDVPIHQEDPVIQITPLIDTVISMKVEAMPKRAWTEKDQQQTDEMLKMIDNLLLERQIMRSLEGLVGGRNIKTDKRVLLRTI
ncbi:hypothetical protein Tco_1195522 [Tanacetum coccineum]